MELVLFSGSGSLWKSISNCNSLALFKNSWLSRLEKYFSMGSNYLSFYSSSNFFFYCLSSGLSNMSDLISFKILSVFIIIIKYRIIINYDIRKSIICIYMNVNINIIISLYLCIKIIYDLYFYMVGICLKKILN